MPPPPPTAHDLRVLTGPRRAAALETLLSDLRSPDPVVRDERAYRRAKEWVPHLDAGELRMLGDRTAEHLAHPEVQARTFAPLVLARIAEAGDWRPEWWDAFARWYPAEQDLRGHDAALGWLHAAAHGADLLAALARGRREPPGTLAPTAVARLLAPTTHLFDAQEDDRIAHALAQILAGPDITAADSERWAEPVVAAFRTGEPGPVPAWASNTMRTLRALYVLADRGFRDDEGVVRTATHRPAVLRAVAGALGIVAPYAA
ncbi:DUF2785 domain-containing protein [Streptomyces sp. RKND-216]|uniref:DUF2785 domain-containing protein n=1 Tax=Streptomyces sp. RKND-216 TaxID=2562581 RepID=UPI00109E1DF0|nr:DUF2785 domain-containing protein [Streptomyces sp. RKND-216]THA24399.1 DUF2785 domain-containing protein [Streptomyces sp. RKND-216]